MSPGYGTGQAGMHDPVGYQCPYCELRFLQRWELEHHLRAEHPEAPDPPGPRDPRRP